MKKIKGIIFDMDGTILNTIDDIADSVNYALQFSGYPIHSVDMVRKAVGNGGMNLIRKVVPSGLSEDKINDVFNIYQAYYLNHNAIKTKPYDGILDLLEILKKRGYKLGVVSNKFHHMVSDLNTEMFKGYFDEVMGEREHIPIKPHPMMIYEILNAMNLKKEEVLFIGDSEVDIQTGLNADVSCIGVTWGFRDAKELLAAGATKLIDHPLELLKWIEG